ncbi:8843_t:CDS:2, partial [Ambispora leptoticha]
LTLVGYRFHRIRLYIYYLLCFLSGGLLYLLSRWLPKLWIWWVGNACEMKKAEWLLVENQWGEISIEKVQRKFYGGTVASIFPSDLLEESDIAKLGTNHMAEETLHLMHYFDHRHLRFIFHPWLGRFLQHGYWKDPSWTNIRSLKTGISREIHNEREVIFGANLIDVEGKSTSQLLYDEVLHPFYIFQIFSIILWCTDEYYYYAICIFIISVTSVTSTLIETKQTLKRLREMSRFVCDVRVFRGGLWRVVSSEDLVPGDIFEISDPNLHIFPCDALLLAGDCIVNESMLTGESIPVSKLPITDTVLQMLDFSSPNFSPDDL